MVNVEDLLSKILWIESQSDMDFILDDMDALITESIEGIQKIKKIVNDLKAFSNPGENRKVYGNINDFLDSTLSMIWNKIKNNEIIRDFGEITEIECYPQKLNQVFMNILLNASQALKKLGGIKIKTRFEENNIIIEIEDTGDGIPPENHSRLFGPFYTTKDIGKGTELGLHYAYKIVELHNGYINVHSEPQVGTVFTIILPV